MHVFLAILRPHDARDDVNRDEGIHPITRDDGSVEKALTRAPVPHPPCHPVLHAATVPARCDIRPGRANYDRRMRLEGLTPHQEDLVNRWWPDAALVADLSWPEALTRVLHLRSRRGDVVVKAGGDVTRHHITREIAAGEQVHGDGLPQLLAADDDAHLLLLAYQSGYPAQHLARSAVPVAGTPDEETALEYSKPFYWDVKEKDSDDETDEGSDDESLDRDLQD